MGKVSIKKNYIYNTFYQILTLITPLITAPYVSRIFEPSGIGIQSYTNSIVMYFTLFAALGTITYGQREIAMHRDNKQEASKLFWEIELLSILTTSICLVIWFVFIFFYKEYRPYFLVQTMTIVAVMFDISWYFGGFEQFKFIVIRNTVVKLLGVVCLFVFIKEKNDLLLYMGLVAATGLLGNISMWTYLPKFLVKVNFKNLNVLRHFKETLIYFIPTIASSIYTVLDKTMIGLITSNTSENGYYEQATKIVKMSLSLIISLNVVMESRMSYLFSKSKIYEIKERLEKSINFSLLLAIPMVFGLCGIAKNFVPWFFGDGYESVSLLMYIYSFIIIPIAISNCLGGQYLTPSGQRSKSAKAIIAGSIVNLILNSFFIPLFGANGAATASVIAESVIAILYLWMSKGYMSGGIILKHSYKRIFSGIVMLIAIIFIGKNYCGSIIVTIVQMVVGILIYFLMLLLMKDKLVKEIMSMFWEKFYVKINMWRGKGE